MNIRIVTIVIGLLDALVSSVIAVASYNSGSDPATIGFDYAAGVIVAVLFAVTGLPALIIAYRRRAPRTALGLALAFPALFVVLFVATVIVFAKSAKPGGSIQSFRPAGASDIRFAAARAIMRWILAAFFAAGGIAHLAA